MTPLAAASYIVGHADTGRRLRLSEAATEVVKADPANFSFPVISVSATVLAGGTVARYPASEAPRTEVRERDARGQNRVGLCGPVTVPEPRR